MNPFRIPLWVAAAASVALLIGCSTVPHRAPSHLGNAETALDRYVKAPDDHYRYELVKTIPGDGYTGYILKMTSQQWLTAREVDQPVWWHWVFIVRPNTVSTDIGLLVIGGGDNDDDPPQDVPGRLVYLARGSNSVVAQINQVPNQPLNFIWDEDRPREEDEIIAYTWDKYLQTGDEKWPLRLPMTKSAVRAMDTVTAFCATPAGGNVTVSRFVVTGGSKRGWTTWTTAAVDSRVVGIVPIVIDMLNVEPSFIHHFEVYGKYARAVGDYEEMNIMAWTGTPEYRQLMLMVEPYEYRARYTMPKFIINSTGDQFFLPDSSQFYWNDLPDEKRLRYVPNTDHGLGGSDATESVLAWYHALINNVPVPEYDWTVDEDGAIRVTTNTPPREVRLWRASNATERNFMKAAIGEAWSSVVLPPQPDGSYVGRVPRPERGWTAYLVELTYPSGTTAPFKFTTEVKITPDVTLYKYKYPKPQDRAPGFIEKAKKATRAGE